MMLAATPAGNTATGISTPSMRNFSSRPLPVGWKMDVAGAGLAGGGQHRVDAARGILGIGRIQAGKLLAQDR